MTSLNGFAQNLLKQKEEDHLDDGGFADFVALRVQDHYTQMANGLSFANAGRNAADILYLLNTAQQYAPAYAAELEITAQQRLTGFYYFFYDVIERRRQSKDDARCLIKDVAVLETLGDLILLQFGESDQIVQHAHQNNIQRLYAHEYAVQIHMQLQHASTMPTTRQHKKAVEQARIWFNEASQKEGVGSHPLMRHPVENLDNHLKRCGFPPLREADSATKPKPV